MTTKGDTRIDIVLGLQAQRDRAMKALELLVEYVKREGGFMAYEDQARLRHAESVLKEPRE